jgi:hypothetical protein
VNNTILLLYTTPGKTETVISLSVPNPQIPPMIEFEPTQDNAPMVDNEDNGNDEGE